jgi:hypothetical protein
MSNLTFGTLALGDVADVALDDAAAVLIVEIGHDFNFLMLPVPAFERQVFVANLVHSLQHLEHFPRRGLVFEQSDFIEFLPDQTVMRIAQHPGHERIGLDDFTGAGVEEENSVVRRFKEPAVADF